MTRQEKETSLLCLLVISLGLFLSAAQPVCATNDGATIDGITLGSSLAKFKTQLKKANIAGLKRTTKPDEDSLGESYITNKINLGSVSWHPDFGFVNDESAGIQRLASIVGAISNGEYSTVLNELSQKYGKPHPDCDGDAWDIGKGCKILLTGGTQFPHATHRLEFTQNKLWNKAYQGNNHTPVWYYKWFLFTNNGHCETVNGIALNSTLDEFKKEVQNAHLIGLKTLNRPDGTGASYKVDGTKIGSLSWHPEFLFVNDNGRNRLVAVAGNVARGEYSAVLNELTRLYGKPRVDEVGDGDSSYIWDLGKTCDINLSRGHKFHNNDHLIFTHGQLWEQTIHGGYGPKWYEKWFGDSN